jgi:hypothetical protein
LPALGRWSTGHSDRPSPPREWAVKNRVFGPGIKEFQVARGTVKWFKTLAEGEALEFDVTQGPKGLQASNVRKA